MKTLLLFLIALTGSAQVITPLAPTTLVSDSVNILNTDFGNVAAALALKQNALSVAGPIRLTGSVLDCPTCVTVQYVLTSAGILTTLSPNAITNGYLANPQITINGQTVPLGGSFTTPAIPTLASQITNALDGTQTYSNPTWLTALPYAKITGAPAFITGAQVLSSIGAGGVTNSYLVSPSITINGITCTLGGGCTVASSGTVGLADPGANGLVKRTAANASAPALAADVTALFTGCSGIQYLGADGACHTAGTGGGTSTFAALTDAPTANALLNTALNAKQNAATANTNNELPLTFTAPLARTGNTISLTGGGAGTGFPVTLTAITAPVTTTAVTHGKGASPSFQCFDSGLLLIICPVGSKLNVSGDVTIGQAGMGSFTGSVIIHQ